MLTRAMGFPWRSFVQVFGKHYSCMLPQIPRVDPLHCARRVHALIQTILLTYGSKISQTRSLLYSVTERLLDRG